MPNGAHILARQEGVSPAGDGPPAKLIEESKKIAKLNVREIDPHVESLLKTIVVGKHVLHLQKNTTAFTQGGPGGRDLFHSVWQSEGHHRLGSRQGSSAGHARAS